MCKDALAGEVAIVTGTTSGIGRSTARALLRAGAHVIGVARRPAERFELFEEDLRETDGDYVHVTGDVKDGATATSAVKVALERFGRIDILVNNAGVGHYADFVDGTVELYDEVMDTNMRSTYAFTLAVTPTMISQGAGLILQIASQAGLRGFPREAVYCASKHAQVGFTRALRQELQPHGIRVGVICPAGVKTNFAIGRGRTEEFVEQAGFLTPDDVADAVMFSALQSPDARMVEMGLIALGEAL